MKIAFCFLTQSDVLHPGIWRAFFADAPADRFNIYCHAKTPGGITGSFLAGKIIREYVPTQHGHISIVAASLALFDAAFADDAENAYFILLSESTIPIVPFAVIRDELALCDARSLVSFSVPPPRSEHHARLEAVANNEIFTRAFYAHDQWVVLHRRHVEALRGRSYLTRFAQVFAADEHYFMNVLVNAQHVPLDQFINRRTTFVNWQEREIRRRIHRETGRILSETVHPKTYRSLSAADLETAEDAWFFRKVAASCDCDVVLERLRAPRE